VLRNTMLTSQNEPVGRISTTESVGRGRLDLRIKYLWRFIFWHAGGPDESQ
jgi:hypothetical protein